MNIKEQKLAKSIATGDQVEADIRENLLRLSPDGCRRLGVNLSVMARGDQPIVLTADQSRAVGILAGYAFGRIMESLAADELGDKP
jgi:hypothetical protein